MKYSLTTGGLLVAVAGLVLVQYGFSDTCSDEIIAKASPLLGALPGIVMSWIGRVRQGDVTKLGFKKSE